MRISTWLFVVVCLIVGFVAAGLWSWPSYQKHQQIKSGLRAAELGAQLAFMENAYRAKNGVFTADFSNLEPFMDTAVPCPLTPAPYSCNGYIYTLEKPSWLLASLETDPDVYIAFELEQGGVDCSHAPQALEKTPVCSSFE